MQVRKVTDGLLGTITDLLLYELFFLGNLGEGGKSTRGAYKAIWKANQNLQEFNYQTIKQGLAYLKRKGLIRILKEPAITAAGKKRLNALFPAYDSQRKWDGSIYIITYDIDEKEKYARDRFRKFIQKLGAGLLQESVWLTVFNPSRLIKEYVEKEKIGGEIMVSCLGKDGYIGEEDLKHLLIRVFHLEELNCRYGAFIENHKDKQKANGADTCQYWSILQDDPQLPFELLPDDWLGDKAYRLAQKLVKR